MRMYRILGWAVVIGVVVMLTMVAGCKKSSTIGAVAHIMQDTQPVFDTLVPADAFYFWEGKIQGRYVTFEEDEYGLWNSDSLGIYVNVTDEETTNCSENDTIHYYYKMSSLLLRPEIPDWRIEVNLYECVKPDDDQFDTTFEMTPNLALQTSVGAWPFANFNFKRRGAEVIFTDSLANEWKTDPGSGQLIDTYFRVTDVYPNPDTTDTTSFYVLEGEFAGRLYNGSSELFVTESTFRLRFRNKRIFSD